MSAVMLCALLAIEFISKQVVDARIKPTEFKGPYLWEGDEYNSFVRTYMPGGYIDEYTNKETFCTSWVFNTGVSQLGTVALAVCYLLFLIWLFIGIQILSDIFMEAIEQITSKSELVEIPDSDGNLITVEKQYWNPTIANLTLMALGSSAPEIILSLADTLSNLGDIPSELGPQTIVGSAAFNLLIITALSILAVKDELKPIKMVGVFIATATFSSMAYVWFFFVLVVISPGVVELWEALTTLGFMILLVIIAYGCDKAHSSKEDEAEKRAQEKKSVCKAALRILVKKFGVKTILEIGQGHHQPNNVSINVGDIANVNSYFLELLEKDPKEASIDELLDCTQPENAVERIMYRKEVSSMGGNREFVRLGKGEKGQAQEDKKQINNPSTTVCFRHIDYKVSESNGHCSIIIEKKMPKAFTFWARTVDGLARAGEDYEGFNEKITMQANENEREIKIGIVDDPNWEPDEEFKVVLLDAESENRLAGDDTECTVLILDEDKPGMIGFAETVMSVSRKDKVAYVIIKRIDGSDGEVSCLANTNNDITQLPGKLAGVPYEDFIPFEDKQIVFQGGESQHRIEIAMPVCEDKGEAGAEGHDTVSFSIHLSGPKPLGLKLSKKQRCIINIEPVDDAEDEREDFQRRKMLEFFINAQEPSWADQFKIACMLGPSINEENLIVEEVGCFDAVWQLLSIFWKVFGATVPPRPIWGGWAAFIVSLALIGVVTTIVGQVATVLGCVINLKPSVTGITLVALGTSLPDTFASMTAARSSPDADSAIGNITGSNSVNVFLGLGLPWTLACVWWLVKHDSDYHVPPGSMAFSVVMFTAVSTVCFTVLLLRRQCLGAELGGSGPARPISAGILVFLWFIYVLFVTLESYSVLDITIGDIPPPPEF